MEDKKCIAVFDFDGTITTADTLIKFIIFSKGISQFIIGFTLYSPLILAHKLGLYPNWKVKQKVFSFFFKGMRYNEFSRQGIEFAEVIRRLERKLIIETLLQHKSHNYKIVVISASVEEWVKPYCEKALGVDIVLGTCVEVDDSGCLTGNFSSPNCYGEEKVNRLLQVEPDRENYYLYAYGDSRGDEEMLDFADEGYKI